MYKGNGITKEFPLPAGADGSVVVWRTENGARRLMEAEAYVVRDWNVVFEVAPPAGVIVAFEAGELAGIRALGVCTVIYPDGRVALIAEDPHELLTAAKAERDEARRLLKEARAEAENLEILVHQQGELSKEKLSARLEKYGGLVEESIKGAAALARDEVKDYLDKLILEIRNKHKAVVAAHEEIEASVKDADRMASTAAGAAERLVHDCCEDAMKACEEIKRIKSETLDLRNETVNAASNAAAGAAKGFEARAGLVLEEVKSLRSTLQGEIKALVEGTKTELDAGLLEIRAQRAEIVRGIKHMNKIERFAIEKEDEIKALAARIVERGNA